jgi:hypothetical protein
MGLGLDLQGSAGDPEVTQQDLVPGNVQFNQVSGDVTGWKFKWYFTKRKHHKYLPLMKLEFSRSREKKISIFPLFLFWGISYLW